MAAAKKKKKDVSGNPNVVIIVFLIMFILSTIGLGLWGYYAQAGQAELQQITQDQKAKAASEKNAKEFYSFLYNDLRLALGEKLTDDENTAMTVDRERFEKSSFGSSVNYEKPKKLMDELKTRLGVGENGVYRVAFAEEIKAAQDRVKDLEAKLEKSISEKKRLEKISDNYTAIQTKFNEDTKDQITKGNTDAFNEVKRNADSFTKLQLQLKEEKDKHQETADALLLLKDVQAEELRKLNKELAILKAEREEDRRLGKAGGPPGGGMAGGGGGAAGPDGAATGTFPLMLDVGGGKALWDHKVGDITRVDTDLRQVTIDRGSEHGVVVGLTFNVFANNADRAFKLLKGTIEVVKVVDQTTSIARITSLYDTRGEEIPLNLRSRTVREMDNFLREGDLLFNLFWGSRVAVAGYVSITDTFSNSPFEQKRQMDDFLHLLRRNGMQVDAYVDPVDGTLRGSISGRTRYVVLGASLVANDKDKVAVPKMEEKDMEKKDMEKNPDEQPKEPLANVDRIQAVNQAIAKMKKDAVERGLIMISAENFGYMIGYRRARSATEFVRSGFNPTVPNAGIINIEAGKRK